MRVVSLVGNRPQFIKEATLHKHFQNSSISEVIVHSGQHYDANMSDVFFSVLGIKEPDYLLKAGGGSHAEVTGKIMIEFEKAVKEINPAAILVYGDTNTTLAGAIVAAKEKIPLAHIEAGIRMIPKTMPEEVNRVLTDRVSDFLFCPSESSTEALRREGISGKIYMVGDVHYDLFLEMRSQFSNKIFNDLNLIENEFILVTIHREANVDVDGRLKEILTSLQKLSKKVKVVFPIHPRTKKRISEFGIDSLLEGITLIEPVDYLELMGLVERSKMVVTDSGGLQKEAYFAGKRAVVLLEDPGWREIVECGWNKLAEPSNLESLVFDNYSGTAPGGLYGSGDAAKRIVEILEKELR